MPAGWHLPEFDDPSQEAGRSIIETLSGKEYRPITLKGSTGTTLLQIGSTGLSLTQPTVAGLKLTRGADVASAATITLDAGADIFRITGTTTITTINGGVSGRVVFLEFAGVCQVTAGSALKLWNAINYRSNAESLLVLESDGTNWREVGPQSRALRGVLLRTTLQSLSSSGADTTISFDSADEEIGGTYYAGGNPTRLTLPVAGVWRIWASILNDDVQQANGWLRAWFRLNGTTATPDLGRWGTTDTGSGATFQKGGSITWTDRYAAADYLELRVNTHNAAGSNAMQTEPPTVFGAEYQSP